jgi:hypothetical protein
LHQPLKSSAMTFPMCKSPTMRKNWPCISQNDCDFPRPLRFETLRNCKVVSMIRDGEKHDRRGRSRVRAA